VAVPHDLYLEEGSDGTLQCAAIGEDLTMKWVSQSGRDLDTIVILGKITKKPPRLTSALVCVV